VDRLAIKDLAKALTTGGASRKHEKIDVIIAIEAHHRTLKQMGKQI
jgi:hypothetical protein